MGQWDEEAIFAALSLDPTYLGVVASPKRADRLRESLSARGVAKAALERVKSPAGLDLAAESPEEIALSVLAEIVQSRRGVEASTGQPTTIGIEPLADWALDPVCGMRVATSGMHRVQVGERTHHFCSAGCRERFAADPERYLTTLGTKTS